MEKTKRFWCSACSNLHAVGCAGDKPEYYCDRLKQKIVRPANTGCSYFEEVVSESFSRTE